MRVIDPLRERSIHSTFRVRPVRRRELDVQHRARRLTGNGCRFTDWAR